MPALIAAVIALTEYLSLPHVTVPEGRERWLTLEAAEAATAESARAKRDVKSIVDLG
jgi:hypothetical protein